MKNIHRTTNEGLQRLVESYSPRISEYDVLDFLKKKGFDPSSQITKNYASGVAEYLSYPENDDYDLKSWYRDTLMNYPEDFEELPKLNESLAETLDDPDYQDFLHSLSEVVAKESKKWKGRGISISDVCNALDDLSVRYEDLSDEDLDESLNEAFDINSISRSKLIDAIDEFYREDLGNSIIDNKTLEDILAENGASEDDSDPYEGFYHSMSKEQIKNVFQIVRNYLKTRDEDEYNSDIYSMFKLKRAWVDESLNFKTMPIPKEGSTFAFRATVDEPEISRLLQKKNLKFDKVNENGTIVWLIGHGDTDHIATYVPSTKTLYTDSREIFRESYMTNESFKNSNIRKSLKESNNDPLLISSNGNFILVNNSGVGINDTPWNGLEVISRKNARKHVVEVHLDSNSPKFEGDPVHFKYWPDSVSVTHGNRMTRDTLQDTKEYILVLQEAIDFSKMVSDFIKNNDEWNAEVSYNKNFGESLKKR